MKEILKQIDELLQEAEDDADESGYAFEEAFHRGEVSAYENVRALLRGFITQQTQLSKQKEQP